MDLISIVVVTLISLPTILYAYLKYVFQYWKSRNVPHEEPSMPFGNIKGVGTEIHSGHFIKRMYDKFKPTGAKLCGYYFFFLPTVIIVELDLMKRILVKDFSAFDDRGIYYNEEDEPISAHLFNLNGEKWKRLRSRLVITKTLLTIDRYIYYLWNFRDIEIR